MEKLIALFLKLFFGFIALIVVAYSLITFFS